MSDPIYEGLHDALASVLNRLDAMLTAAGSPPETPHEEAVGALIYERDALREENVKMREAISTHRCINIGSLADHLLEMKREILILRAQLAEAKREEPTR